MGNILHIKTDMQWPWGVPFRIPDQFNGHQRGEWYFREPLRGDCTGPFMNIDEATHELGLAIANANRI
jgi:hypothetical protein